MGTVTFSRGGTRTIGRGQSLDDGLFAGNTSRHSHESGSPGGLGDRDDLPPDSRYCGNDGERVKAANAVLHGRAATIAGGNHFIDDMLYLYDCAIIGRAEEGIRVLQTAIRNGIIDRLAIGVSGFCLVHCIASAVLITMLASAGGVLLDPIFHEVGMMIALVLGIIGLGRGMLDHGFMLPAAIGSLGLGTMAGALTLDHGGVTTLYSVAGVLILALGHDLNRRAVI